MHLVRGPNEAGKSHAMPLAIVMIWMQLQAAASLLRHRAVQICIAAAFTMSVLATWFAPDTSPSFWDWFRIILLVGVGALGLLMFLASRDELLQPADRQQRLIGAGLLALVAILLNVTFSLGTAISFSIGFSLIALFAIQDLRGRSPWLLCGLLCVIVPFWVWTALQAWHWGLLILIPLAALAFVSDRHIRHAASTSGSDTPSSVTGNLTRRGHRLGSWLGILGSALLVLVIGMLSDASNTWVALGAIGAVTCIALEAGLPGSGTEGSRRSIVLCDAAAAWIALCWMVSL